MQRTLFKRNCILLTNSIFKRSIHVHQILQRTDSSDSWTNLISTLSQNNGVNAEYAVNEAVRLLNEGVKPTGTALVHVVRVSTDLGYVSCCRQIHGYIMKHGFVSNLFVSNALMRFYKRNDSLFDAHKLFDEIPHPSVISWNSLISGYVQSGRFGRGLGLFLELERSDVCSNAFSFTAALAACGQLSLLEIGRSVHSKIVKFGLENGNVVGNCLIDMYGKCGSVKEAISVFREMDDKDIISWNSVATSCARNGELELALGFFHQIPKPDTISYNELIDGIAQYGDIDDAIQILSSMPNPNSSSWNSILTGYVNRNRVHEALDFFTTMHSMDIKMDEFTFSIMLTGIAGLSALTRGVLIHSCVIKRGLDSAVVVGSALIDMYSKCGRVKNAELVFRTLPRKNLITWNTIISGYAHNGDSLKVIRLFEQMKLVRDLEPDRITFLNVLAACSHTEIPLQNAIQYFKSMINEYGIKPSVEHCCSMIRIMGQRGEVRMAERMIYEMGFGLCAVVWRALLGACGTCRDLKVAKTAAAKLIAMGEHDDDYVYVMMSNMYAYHGRWRQVGLARKLMREKGVRKEAGCSWIVVENVTPNSFMKLDSTRW